MSIKRQAARPEAGSGRPPDPNVLVSKCLDQLAVMVDKGQTIPVGFTCWPSASQQPVIVNQSK